MKLRVTKISMIVIILGYSEDIKSQYEHVSEVAGARGGDVERD